MVQYSILLTMIRIKPDRYLLLTILLLSSVFSYGQGETEVLDSLRKSAPNVGIEVSRCYMNYIR